MRIDEYYNSLITSLLEIIFDLRMMIDFYDDDTDRCVRNQCFIDIIQLNTKALEKDHADLHALKDIKRVLYGVKRDNTSYCIQDPVKHGLMIIDFMIKNDNLPSKEIKEDDSLVLIMKKINNIGDEIRWVNLKSEKLNYAFDNLKDCIKNNRTDVSQDVINDLFKTIRDALKDKPELNVSKLLLMLVEVEYDLRQRCMKIISDSAVPINPADDRFIKMKGAIANSINGVLLKHYTEPVVETNIVSQSENEVKLEVTVKGDYNYDQKH